MTTIDRGSSRSAPQPAPVAAPPAAASKPLTYSAACVGISLLLGIMQGLGVNMVSANLPYIQGSLGSDQIEASWLVTVYMMTNVAMAPLLIKFRNQYGLRLFADLALSLFIVVTAAHLLTNDLRTALAMRAALGIAAAPLTSLALLYMIEAFPPSRLTMALPLGLTATQISIPLARIFPIDLLQIDQWHGIYLVELGLGLMALASVNLLRLPPRPMFPSFDRLDVIVFPLFAGGMAMLCAVLSQGSTLWWTERAWLGWCLAGAIACLFTAAIIELRRSRPMLDYRWLTSTYMLRFFSSILLFRIVLSEQTSGAVGLLTTLGMYNEQEHLLFGFVLLATIAGSLTVMWFMTHDRLRYVLIFALLLIIVAALSDAGSTNLVRPMNFYLTQTAIGYASALFLPAAMFFGITQAFARGPAYLVSFSAIFSIGNNVGGLAGSALVRSFVTWREKFHSNHLVGDMNLGDPEVAQRVHQLSGAFAPSVSDTTLRSAEGAAQLSAQASRESYVLAYNDAFILIACIAAVVLIWFTYLTFRAHRDSTRNAPMPGTARS
ncbi:MFS transporter [Solimonas marina]|uniref:MFS transporter n=1 Tax=Solimonas marina TaxID=2714601 RepID=A0A969W8J5_9GAMM|nr:MFS transporter [Solimonas marina]